MLDGGKIPVENLEQCIDLCYSKDECFGCTFDQMSKICFLKSKMEIKEDFAIVIAVHLNNCKGKLFIFFATLEPS